MKEQICNIIGEHLNVDPQCIIESNYLQDDFGADSLDLVEIQFAIEEQLLDDQVIPDVESDAWETVQDIINSVEKLSPGVDLHPLEHTHFHICIDINQALKKGDHYLHGILADDAGHELSAAEVRVAFSKEMAKGYSFFCGCDNRTPDGRCAGHRKVAASA